MRTIGLITKEQESYLLKYDPEHFQVFGVETLWRPEPSFGWFNDPAKGDVFWWMLGQMQMRFSELKGKLHKNPARVNEVNYLGQMFTDLLAVHISGEVILFYYLNWIQLRSYADSWREPAECPLGERP